jgi:hypothetical protein
MKLLWCHVTRRARIIDVFDTGSGKHSGESKIGKQRFISAIEENIFRFVYWSS